MQLTARDEAIIRTLSFKLRVMAIGQVQRAFWPSRSSLELARRRIRALAGEGLLEEIQLFTNPPIQFEAPLASWKPSAEPPAFGPIAFTLKNRWSEPVRRIPAVAATKRGAGLVGGAGGRAPRASEQAHDLSLAELYLLFEHRRPHRAAGWFKEDLFEVEPDCRHPDVVIAGRQGREGLLVELAGGGYSKRKLEDFHAFAEARGLQYEVW